jgi:hypothetical protein
VMAMEVEKTLEPDVLLVAHDPTAAAALAQGASAVARGGGGGGGGGVYMERRLVTLILINLASIMERADEALLPAVYDQVGKAFGVSPSALGTLTFIRALVQALASPLAAYLTLRHNRIMVIAGGAVAWAIATAAVGSCTAYWQVVSLPTSLYASPSLIRLVSSNLYARCVCVPIFCALLWHFPFFNLV